MRKKMEVDELGIEFNWLFTDAAIEAAPDAPGVFAFYGSDGNLILMGSALKSVRTQLRNHWKGYEGSATCGAAYVAYEAVAKPLEREAELAQVYERRHGRAPRRQAG